MMRVEGVAGAVTAQPLPRISLRGPVVGAAAGALALLLLYMGIIAAAESFDHALQQFRTDAVWVVLVAAGLGTQVGLYLRVRQLARARAAAGAGALAGAGTGTSTAGMIACCMHHLADIAPFIGLTGATTFLSQYRLAFILVGLAVNVLGIAISLRTLGRVKAHLRAAEQASCH